MLYDLRRATPQVKWLVTCLLATFGLAYLFGSLMVSLYAGFTPARVAATYAGPAMTMPMPPDSTVVVEHPVRMEDLSQPEVHMVDTDLLIQDSHVHLPMYGIFAAALSVIVLGLPLSRTAGIGVITLLFAAPWLDFAGMWLTKLLSPHFAVTTLVGGYAMGIGYLVVTGLAVYQMWFSRTGGTPS